ncbi:SRPBCC family protein [Mycobacterium malmoense]|uniref:SRPBCC family protein n=1 Tax=Mycobacterium malmoense TaxID=1780 RepID=UPI0008F9303F|nr:SRPBCC family protein [Mycobacterium malmoense]OIN78701.1 polyketide cyclase [Mycobacterium malmoense]
MADTELERIVSATRAISASADRIFELIADPARQPSWDGNNNLASSAPGQRVRRVGDVFKTTLTNGAVRENHVVEFIEGSKIAWRPAEPRKPPPGHLWRWELSPINATLTSVTHTYDWTELADATRLERARATTADMLRRSIDRLAVLAREPDGGSTG